MIGITTPPRMLLVACALATLLGCSSTGKEREVEQAAPAAASTAVPTTVATSPPIATPTPEATSTSIDACTVTESSDVLSLTSRYSLVQRSRSLSGHADYIDEFADEVDAYYDDVAADDDCSPGVRAAAAALNTDGAQLNVEVLIYDKGKSSTYRQTLKDGQALFEELNYTTYKFGESAFG
jgi:hypothetical protein